MNSIIRAIELKCNGSLMVSGDVCKYLMEVPVSTSGKLFCYRLHLEGCLY